MKKKEDMKWAQIYILLTFSLILKIIIDLHNLSSMHLLYYIILFSFSLNMISAMKSPIGITITSLKVVSVSLHIFTI